MRWPFAKYVGCGNDFILFDNRSFLFPSDESPLIQRLCHRHYGIGADGLILLENSDHADFRMRIFNADGGEAEMCGNGIRCLVQFIRSLGKKQLSYRIETQQRILKASCEEALVTIEMGDPVEMQWDLSIALEKELYQGHYLNTGVPHAVFFLENIAKQNLVHLGSSIRHHVTFQPKGVNVNIAEKLSSRDITMRTYERGIEGETLACGTGATAVALAAAYQYQLEGPLFVHTRSGETLQINFSRHFSSTFSNVTMTGPAHCTYRGEIDL